MFMVAGPGPIICLMNNIFGKINRRLAFFCWLFGCVGAVLSEGVSRHVTYAGFWAPKAMEILLCSLEHKKLIKQTHSRGLVILILSSALLGLAASRGHCNKSKVVKEGMKDDEEYLFYGAFGWILN